MFNVKEITCLKIAGKESQKEQEHIHKGVIFNCKGRK